MTTTRPKHSEWLDQKFIDWRGKQTARKATIGKFAEFIGIHLSNYNNYTLRGTKPKGDDLRKIAEVLGPEIYGLLDLERPDPSDPLYLQLKDLFYKLSPERRKKLVERAEKYADEDEQEDAKDVVEAT